MRENADGSFTLFGPSGEALALPAGSAGLTYMRKKGPKVIFEIPDHGDSIGSPKNALARFSRIIGVDTNSIEVGGAKVSATAVCEVSDVRFDGPRWYGLLEHLWALEFWEPTKDPELIGWRHVLARGEHEKWWNDDSPLLLVVDSHLDRLHHINRREAPVIDNYMLPSGVSIAYASSDAASDSVLNGLIARCHHLAKLILKRISAKESAEDRPGTLSADSPFGAYRYWRFEDA